VFVVKEQNNLMTSLYQFIPSELVLDYDLRVMVMVCFPRSTQGQGFSIQAFLPMTFTVPVTLFCCACAVTVTVVIFGHLKRSFNYLITRLLTYSCQAPLRITDSFSYTLMYDYYIN